MVERKSRSTIDSLLVSPTVEDKKIRAAILEWIRSAVNQLGGWGSLSAFQRASLLSCKISLTILMTEEKVLSDVGSLEDARAVLACKNIETHTNLLRKSVQALTLPLKTRPPAQRGSMLLADIVREYGEKKGSR
jgi:hypothetical protein